MLQMAEIVEDLTFQIDFRHRALCLLADGIQLFDDITQVAVDLINLFETLCILDSLALTRVLKLHALGEKLAFILAEIDFQNVVVRFLTKSIAINIFRMRNSQTFKLSYMCATY